MQFLTNRTNFLAKIIMETELNDFPLTPENGQICFKDGILYIYSLIDGELTWYPLLYDVEYYVHTQETTSMNWEIEHGLVSKDIMFFVYNETDELQYAEMVYDEIDPFNKIYINLMENISGRVIIFSGTDSLAGDSPPSSGIPTGTIIWWPAETPPDGFIKVGGQDESRVGDTAGIYALVGDTFGGGDGSTTFTMPNMQGVVARGFDEDRGLDTGRVFGTYQADEIGSHRHTITYYESDPASTGDSSNRWDTSTNLGVTRTMYSDYQGGTENRMKNIALLPCMKL